MLLGQRGARRARHRPRHGPRALHARPARRVPRRRRRAVAGRARRRADAEPVRALQRQRAPRRDARLRRPPRRRDADHRPLRAPHARRACCAWRPTRPRTRPTCSPALSRATLARLRFPLGDLDKAAGARDRRRARAAGRLQARLAGPLLPGRHRARGASWPATAGWASARATSSTAAGRVLGRHRGAHRFTVGQRRGLEVGGARRAALRAAHRRGRQHRDRRPARGAGHDRRRACATCACTRRPREVDAVKLRYRAPAVPVHAARRHDRARPSPSTAPPRARPRSSCAATPCWDAPQSLRDLRRDPRALPGLLRGARPPAPAQRVARARELRPLGPAHDRGHAAAQALLPGHREAAAPAAHHLPEVLPHRRHRERRHDARAT